MWEKKACLRAGCATGRGEWWKLKRRNEGYKWSESGEGADNWEGHLESERERRRHRLLGESAREREGRLQSRAQTANTSLTYVVVRMYQHYKYLTLPKYGATITELMTLKMMMFLTAPPQCMMQGLTAGIIPSLFWLQEQGYTYH